MPIATLIFPTGNQRWLIRKTSPQTAPQPFPAHQLTPDEEHIGPDISQPIGDDAAISFGRPGYFIPHSTTFFEFWCFPGGWHRHKLAEAYCCG